LALKHARIPAASLGGACSRCEWGRFTALLISTHAPLAPTEQRVRAAARGQVAAVGVRMPQ